MSAWAILGLLLAGVFFGLALVAVGICVANYFSNISMKKYQQGLNDGWRAYAIRGDVKRPSGGKEVRRG